MILQSLLRSILSLIWTQWWISPQENDHCVSTLLQIDYTSTKYGTSTTSIYICSLHIILDRNPLRRHLYTFSHHHRSFISCTCVGGVTLDTSDNVELWCVDQRIIVSKPSFVEDKSTKSHGQGRVWALVTSSSIVQSQAIVHSRVWPYWPVQFYIVSM